MDSPLPSAGFLEAIPIFRDGVVSRTCLGKLSVCRKAVRLGANLLARAPNFNPGGMVSAPVPSPTPMLDLQVQSRHSIYDSSETTGEFIVDTGLSYIHGQPYVNKTSVPGYGQPQPFTALDFDIRIDGTDQLLVSNSVPVNTTSNLFQFNLGILKPRLTPYHIVLYGAPTHEVGSQNYTATTELYYLPAKNSGSTVKVDNLYGGMLVANNATKYGFEPLLPFGFYTSCSGYLNYSLANVSAYKALGFNAINPVCAFTDGNIGFLFDWMDEVNLWYQYDMRGSYLNLTQVEQQIPLVKDRSNLLHYYTADEPDGWQYALNSTRLAYDLLKSRDPYHPTALVLNCDNYYFEQYTSGTDIIMEDAYPIGINTTYSIPWNTPCNETYGDCGCDDCVGELQDVSNRLDVLYEYQEWLDLSQKPLWAVLQAFSGEGYWSRDPTPEETWAMMTISFNHRAKGIMSWTFPSTKSLNDAHGQMAKATTVAPISTFLISGQPTAVKIKGNPLIDVAYWKMGNQMMVSVADLRYTPSNKVIEIPLPAKASKIASQPWGSLGWSLSGGVLKTQGINGLATSIVILDI